MSRRDGTRAAGSAEPDLRSVRRRRIALCLLAGALLPSCSVEPYCFDCVEDVVDAGPRMDATGDAPGRDAPGVDGEMTDDVPPDSPPPLPDGCTMGAPELCNLGDDDCDTRIDEGFDTSTDVSNCGGCGVRCAPPNAFGMCSGGTCSFTECAPTYFDRDGIAANGCETRCIVTEDPEMTCNRRDDDCDSRIDETFDLMTDPVNCGACGRICRAPHAASGCASGVCTLGACDPGFIDLDGLESNGCEFGCTPASPAVESCNLRDDDCDGRTDEGDPGSGAVCGDGTGACETGIEHCVGGSITCVGGTSPTTETCNGEDDDCDGTVDDNNPDGGRACGSSVGACRPGREVCTGGVLVCTGEVMGTAELCNAIDDDCDGTIDDGNPEGGATCGTDTGACTAGVVTCMGGGLTCAGSVGPSLEICNTIDDDCDGTADQTFDTTSDIRNCGMCGRVCTFANAVPQCMAGSCRLLACLPGFRNTDMVDANGCEHMCTPSGPEACDGEDNDCDTRVDEGVTAPPGVCNPNGVCATGTVSCGGTMGWQCTLPATYEAVETRCDSLDNDCDGSVDEPFPLRGTACNNGELGTCRRTGTFVCNAGGTAVVCNAPAVGMGTAEQCDNDDDDCDGRMDESAPGTWTLYTTSGGATRYIMSYEASRPDATGAITGIASHRVCSEPGRLPWTTVTYPEAVAACATVGATLCTEAEWQRACETNAPAASACFWSESTTCRTFDTLCNTNEFDTTPGGADNDAILATGSRAMCFANWPDTTVPTRVNEIFDMSGNVQEWTVARSAGVNPMRGGTSSDPSGGTTCQFNFEVASDTIALPNVGFRCCRTTAP